MEADLPLIGALQQVDAPQQGGLAGAGGAQNAGDIAGVDSEVHIPEDLVRPKGLGEVASLQNGFQGHVRAPPSSWGRVRRR